MLSIDFTTVFGQVEMDALGQGLLSISIHARNAPQNIIRGYLVPRLVRQKKKEKKLEKKKRFYEKKIFRAAIILTPFCLHWMKTSPMLIQFKLQKLEV